MVRFVLNTKRVRFFGKFCGYGHGRTNRRTLLHPVLLFQREWFFKYPPSHPLDTRCGRVYAYPPSPSSPGSAGIISLHFKPAEFGFDDAGTQ